MRFYNQHYKYYCGIDLNARKMPAIACILNPECLFCLLYKGKNIQIRKAALNIV
jgi:hypothetical protein